MTYLNFIYAPGGDNEGGGTPVPDDSEKVTDTVPESAEPKEEKPIIEKIKEALQDWSNKDEADQTLMIPGYRFQ